MPVLASRTKLPFDIAAGTLLRDPAATARAATGTDIAVSLKELRTAYWHNFEIPHGLMRVGISVSFGLFGGSTYTPSLLTDDTANLSDAPVTVAAFPALPGVGYYEFAIDSKTIPGLDPDHSGSDKWIASRITVAGTPLAITGAVNNGSGKVRLTVGTTANLISGATYTISGIVGTTEANGTFVITVVSATQVDLLTVTFTNAYVSGGQFDPVIKFGVWIGKSTDA